MLGFSGVNWPETRDYLVHGSLFDNTFLTRNVIPKCQKYDSIEKLNLNVAFWYVNKLWDNGALPEGIFGDSIYWKKNSWIMNELM